MERKARAEFVRPLFSATGVACIAHGAWVMLKEPPEYGARGIFWALFGLVMQGGWIRLLIRRALKLEEPVIAKKSVLGRSLVTAGFGFMPTFAALRIWNLPEYDWADAIARAFEIAVAPTVVCVAAGIFVWWREEYRR